MQGAAGKRVRHALASRLRTLCCIALTRSPAHPFTSNRALHTGVCPRRAVARSTSPLHLLTSSPAHGPAPRPSLRSGISLMEVLISIAIMAIGLLSVAASFPSAAFKPSAPKSSSAKPIWALTPFAISKRGPWDGCLRRANYSVAPVQTATPATSGKKATATAIISAAAGAHPGPPLGPWRSIR